MRMMTIFLATSLLSSAIVLSGGCASSSSNRTQSVDRAALESEGPIQTETATLVVHGMGCPLCANNVDKQLLTVPGVEDVRIDLGNGTVTVSLADNDRPTKAQLAKAIDDSGFTLISIATP